MAYCKIPYHLLQNRWGEICGENRENYCNVREKLFFDDDFIKSNHMLILKDALP